MKNKKLILILVGEGANAAFQVGAWNKVIQSGVSFDATHFKAKIPNAVFGVSTGSLNGAMIAMGKFRELLKLWNQPELRMKGLLSDRLYQQGILEQSGAGSFDQQLLDQANNFLSYKDMKSDFFEAGYLHSLDGTYHPFQFDMQTNDLAFQKAILIASSSSISLSSQRNISANNPFLHTFEKQVNTTLFGQIIRYINAQEDHAEYHLLIISSHARSSEVPEPNICSSNYDMIQNKLYNSDLNQFLLIDKKVQAAAKKGLQLFSKSGRLLKSFKVKMIHPQRRLKGIHDFTRSSVMDSFLHGYGLANSL